MIQVITASPQIIEKVKIMTIFQYTYFPRCTNFSRKRIFLWILFNSKGKRFFIYWWFKTTYTRQLNEKKHQRYRCVIPPFREKISSIIDFIAKTIRIMQYTMLEALRDKFSLSLGFLFLYLKNDIFSKYHLYFGAISILGTFNQSTKFVEIPLIKLGPPCIKFTN